MTVGREQLYGEVWAEPMTKVAARYGVSSSFLARICERLGVPRPPRGYWAQLAVGKAPSKPALPEARPGDELEWSREGPARRMPRALPKAPENRARRRSRGSARPAQHPLLVGAEAHFEKARVSRDDYLKPWKQLVVDVFTSKEANPAALALANDLFLALEDRGHQVTLAPRDQRLQRPVLDVRETGKRDQYLSDSWRPGRPTVVFVGTVAIGLTIYELTEEVEVRWVDGKYVRVDAVPQTRRRRPAWDRDWTHKRDMPSGRLALRCSSPYAGASWEKLWSEAKPGELKSKLKSVVRELEQAAPTIADLVKEAERKAEIERKKWEVQREQWAREEAERRWVQAQKDSREELLNIIERWALATRIESFFENVTQGIDGVADDERGELLERLDRARELFGGPDALRWFRSWKLPEER